MHRRPGRRRVQIGLLILGVLTPSAGWAACSGQDLFEGLRASGQLAPIEDAAAAMPFRHGRLFRVQKEGQAPSFVFGTLHLADPRITQFSPALRAAIAGARQVFLESIEPAQLRGGNPVAMRALGASLRAEPGRGAATILSPGERGEVEAALSAKRLDPQLARTLKPGALALLLDLPSCAAVRVGDPPYVDALVARLARDAKRPVQGLETLAEQIEILDDLTAADARGMLVAVVRQARRGGDVVETTIRRFVESDLGVLLAFTRANRPLPGVEGAGLPPAVMDRLLDRRTRRFVERSQAEFDLGGVFVAVGATHLPGADGVLAQLEKNGFRIEPVE